MKRRYGELNAETTQPVVRQNPVEIAIELLDIWRTSTTEFVHTRASLELSHEIFQPFAPQFADLRADELDHIVTLHQLSGDRLDGYMIDQIFNASQLPVLRGKFDTIQLGYQLDPDKIIMVDEGSYIDTLGTESHGTIVNKGNIVQIGTSDGLFVNHGFVAGSIGNLEGVILDHSGESGFRPDNNGLLIDYSRRALKKSSHINLYISDTSVNYIDVEELKRNEYSAYVILSGIPTDQAVSYFGKHEKRRFTDMGQFATHYSVEKLQSVISPLLDKLTEPKQFETIHTEAELRAAREYPWKEYKDTLVSIRTAFAEDVLP